MAATLAMSGGGQEEPFYPPQKDALPLGFLLEDSLLFGLDCKVADKSVHSDYAQVRRSGAHTRDGFGGNGRGRGSVEARLHRVSPRSDPRPAASRCCARPAAGPSRPARLQRVFGRQLAASCCVRDSQSYQRTTGGAAGQKGPGSPVRPPTPRLDNSWWDHGARK